MPSSIQPGIFLSRKLSSGKSICRINGETVTAKQVKELSELLIDIHGQHEHQSLLNKKKHMEILDAYAGADAAKGIAPSVMNARPMMKLVGPASLSSLVNLFLNNRVASAMAQGGVIPPIITAAMIS